MKSFIGNLMVASAYTQSSFASTKEMEIFNAHNELRMDARSFLGKDLYRRYSPKPGALPALSWNDGLAVAA